MPLARQVCVRWLDITHSRSTNFFYVPEWWHSEPEPGDEIRITSVRGDRPHIVPNTFAKLSRKRPQSCIRLTGSSWW